MCNKIVHLVSSILVLVVTSSAYADLVSHWTLDEGFGTIVNDSSGNGNNGTFVGNPQWIVGIKGGALEFDGTSYVDCGNDASLDITGPFSAALWIKPGTDGSLMVAPLCKAESALGWNWQLRYGWNTAKPTIMGWQFNTAGGSTWLFVDQELPIGEWYHIAAAHDGSTVKCYLNGEETDSAPMSSFASTTSPLIIGSDGWRYDWIGGIDDVRLYDHGLSSREILAIMQGTMPPYAWGPEPSDGTIWTQTWANLKWNPGPYAVSHNVYLGDNFDDVNDGVGNTFRLNQTTTSFLAGFPGYAYPDGLVPGTTYYWRIDEVNDADPNSPWKGNVWSFWIPPQKAYDPDPADGTKYIDLNVTLNWTAGMNAKLHYVYFGDNFEDVNSSTVGHPQTPTSYTPGPLGLGKDYYWRIDEFDGVSTHKGDVWGFKTQPEIAIANPNLVGWWSLDEGMGTTALDWSGHGNHGTLFGPKWAIPGFLGDAALDFSNGGYVAIQNLKYNSTGIAGVTVCAWIRTKNNATQFIASFDRNEYWRLEINGYGGGDGQVGWDLMTSGGQLDNGSVTRVDDGRWHHVCGVFDNGRATIYIDGEPESSGTGGPTFGSGNTRFGFIGANSEASGFNGSRGGGIPISGDIDDMRIYDKALTAEEIKLVMRGDIALAWNPSPVNGSTPYIRDVLPLSWSPGDNASGHDVYFGVDRDAVADADASDTAGVYRGRQSATVYNPPEGVEWGGGPYYWRIDQYNTDATISRGTVWTFTVADYIGIDDFEDYNDYEPDRIFDTWTDGWGIPTNGSEVGYAEPNFTLGEHHVETTIVHGGLQSLPYFYDNNFKYSEATLPLVSARNWTEEGVAVLSLWFFGNPFNAAEQMYVSISNANGVTGTVYHDDPSAARIATWTQWTIELKKFADQGVNLTNVDKFYIGFGDKANLQAGGSGKMYFDDIRLYRPSP